MTPLTIGVTAGAYIAMLLVERNNPDLYERAWRALALDPSSPRPWAFLTYALLHDQHGFLHIAGNMLFLWVFGPSVEDRLGRAGFAVLYLVSSAAAGGAHVLFDSLPVVGASGAIAGVTGAFLALFPRTHIRVLLFFFIIGVFAIPAWWFILLRIVLDFVPLGSGLQDGVAHAAHLGGYVCGLGAGLVLSGLRIIPREPWDLFSIGRQARRRRQLKEAAASAQRPIARPLRSEPADPALPDGAAEARSNVAGLMASGDLAGAVREYRALLDGHGRSSPAATLSRRHLYDLANHLYASGEPETAAIAYEKLLEAYPDDREGGHIRLMLGRIAARHLNDPVAARRWLEQAIATLTDEEDLGLARAELSDLG